MFQFTSLYMTTPTQLVFFIPSGNCWHERWKVLSILKASQRQGVEVTAAVVSGTLHEPPPPALMERRDAKSDEDDDTPR